MNAADEPTPPTPDVTFDVLPLSEPVRRALDEIGYVQPTPVQRAVYASAVERRDLIVQARTGTGKTAAFAIPMVDRLISQEAGAQALILAPTRELALQSAREVERIGRHREIKTVAIYGGAPMGRQISELEAGAQIVSGTPGRVLDHLKRGTLDASNIRLLVLDEMDEMLSMGFAKELHAILERLPEPRQTMCFSATMDESVQRIAERHMRNPEVISLSTDAIGASEITHYVYMVSGSSRSADLIQILENEDPESAIIFCNLKSETERVASDLQQAGFNADWLNGDLPQRDRESVMTRTRSGDLRYLVATDVAARGIDVSHLTHVINYAFPENSAQYVHRTGRTGRAGRTGTAISLVSPPELGRLYYLRLECRIFPVERSLPTRGEINTRQEADYITLLEGALVGEPSAVSRSLARRLLTHPDVERIVGGLLQGFLGTRGDDVAEEASTARRARRPEPVAEPSRSDRGPRQPREDRGPRAERPTRSERPDRSERPAQSQTRGDASNQQQNDDAMSESTGMLFLKLGRKDGLLVGEIARLLRDQCGLEQNEVGRIRVRDKYTFVGVPEEKLEEILTKLAGCAINDRPLDAERARVTRA
jgi:ATP-dependent RNA helicase DeaD